jgi:anti-anti-sigma factor
MSVNTKVESGVLHIRISGRFDFGVHNEFREATKLAELGVQKIIVDMSQTDYLDSSALGMLLVLRDKVGGNKDAVRLTGARTEVKKILEIANFDKLFTVA